MLGLELFLSKESGKSEDFTFLPHFVIKHNFELK